MSREEANRIVQAAQQMLRARKAVKIALPTAAALGAGAAIAVGSTTGGGGVITGCYAGTTGAGVGRPLDGPTVKEYTEPPGALRVIDPSLPKTDTTTVGAAPEPEPARQCEPGETTITWDQTGPQGPQGERGPQGPAGGQGANGANGANGAPLIGETAFGMQNDAGEIFLKLDGVPGESAIKGESTVKLGGSPAGDAGDIKIDSFSLGAAAQTNIGSQSSGAGAGKATFQTFTITKQIDSASPKLFQAAATGETFKEGTLYFTHKLKGAQQNFLEIKLSDLQIKSIQDGASSGGAPEEEVTFDFLKIEETFLPNGNKSPGATVGWNVIENKAF
jgi:type VI secretion system secreted protein Hcp